MTTLPTNSPAASGVAPSAAGESLSPLAELHRHLDGSLRRSTLEDLARQHNREIPDPLGFWPGMGLDQALAQFAVTLSVLQNPAAVERVAAEMCEDAETEGIATLEIRFAPQLHRGASTAAIVDAALAGANGRAGLILCGLYGEPPSVLQDLVAVAADRPGVVGIDLAGGPTPAQEFAMDDYAPAFARAKELGIGRTVHAGEGRPADEIRRAIELLGAQRIGHGTTLLDDPELVDLVRERGITIEACPTSNLQTGAISAISDHPIQRWLELGVSVCVCTDNTLLSNVDLPGEYRRVIAEAGVDRAGAEACIAAGHAGAFRR